MTVHRQFGTELKSALSAGLDVIYPRSCLSCGKDADSEYQHVCWDCLSRTEVIVPPFCRLCGDPVDGMVEHEYTCSACADSRPSFDLGRSAVRYRGPVRTILHLFKYERAVFLSDDLSNFLHAVVATHFRDIPFDAVTCVPLHARRERERTYNQAAVLAQALAGRMSLPCLPDCLIRLRDTPSQTHYSASQRRQNVRRAFGVRHVSWVDGRRFLLVDDVMTTGSTVDECAHVLKKAGAVTVHVITVARG